MFCKKCGKQIDNDSSYCPFCGAKLNPSVSDKEKRTVVFDGELHKCPNCGEIIKAFEIKCHSCGYELRGANRTHKVEELIEKLGKAPNLARRKELISNFFVPNTKEDIIEFFTLGCSQVDDSSCSDAWNSKLEQILMKAKLLFGESEEYQYLLQLKAKADKDRRKYKVKKFFKNHIGVLIGCLVIIIGIIFIALACTKAKNYDSVFGSPYFWMLMVGVLLAFGGVMTLLISIGSKDNKREERFLIEKEKIRAASRGKSKKSKKKQDEEEDLDDDFDDEEEEDEDEEDEEEEEDEEDDEDEEDEDDDIEENDDEDDIFKKARGKIKN